MEADDDTGSVWRLRSDNDVIKSLMVRLGSVSGGIGLSMPTLPSAGIGSESGSKLAKIG